MTALYIVLGIAVFVTLIALLRVTLILDAEDTLTLTVRVLFLRFKLLPKIKRPPNLKHFRIKAFRRRRLKEEKRFRKRELARAAASKKKEKKAEAVKAAGQEPPKRSLKENMAFGIDLVKYVVLRVLKTFGKRLRIDIRSIDITVASGDAAKTAVTFGYVCQGVAYIKELLDRCLHVRYPEKREGTIRVRVDYLAEKSTFKVHMAFHIRVWQVFSLGIAALKGYLSMPKHEPKAKTKDRSEPPSSEASSESSTPIKPIETIKEKSPQ